eukprot:9385487-Lingulodinium_polyedra.AAC.1
MPRMTRVASAIWPLPLGAMDLLNSHTCSQCNVSTINRNSSAVAVAVAAARSNVMPPGKMLRWSASARLITTRLR